MVPCQRNHRHESEIHLPEILRIKAVCVLNSGGQTFVPGGCMLLYDSLFWNEAFTPTLLPPSFTFRKVRACFYLFFPLGFSLERLGMCSQSQMPTLIPAGCLGLSARLQSQLYITKAFPLPGPRIAFAPVPCLASILQLLKGCCFFSPA